MIVGQAARLGVAVPLGRTALDGPVGGMHDISTNCRDRRDEVIIHEPCTESGSRSWRPLPSASHVVQVNGTASIATARHRLRQSETGPRTTGRRWFYGVHQVFRPENWPFYFSRLADVAWSSKIPTGCATRLPLPTPAPCDSNDSFSSFSFSFQLPSPKPLHPNSRILTRRLFQISKGCQGKCCSKTSGNPFNRHHNLERKDPL